MSFGYLMEIFVFNIQHNLEIIFKILSGIGLWWWWIRQFLRHHNTAHAVTRAPSQKLVACQRYDFSK